MTDWFDKKILARDEREGITDAEILAVLNAVDRGEISITKLRYEHYKLGNGWVVEIFWDVGEWDYIKEITLPDGRCINTFESDPERVPIQDWIPEHPERWEE